MPDKTIIVAIGCSQGGVEALIGLSEKFDPMWQATIIITSHIGRRPSNLPEILQRRCRLRVVHARNDTTIEPNNVYIAPPDPSLHLWNYPEAQSWSDRELDAPCDRPDVPVNLSKSRAGRHWYFVDWEDGGWCQRPHRHSGSGWADHRSKSGRCDGFRASKQRSETNDSRLRVLLEHDAPSDRNLPRGATMTGYNMHKPYAITCPECGGALFPVNSQPAVYFECHIGHKLSPEAMMESQMTRLESSLSTVMVVMKERSELCRQLVEAGVLDMETADVMVAEANERAFEIKNMLERPWTPIPDAL